MNTVTITALEDKDLKRIPTKNKGIIQLLLLEYSTILQKGEYEDRKVTRRVRGERRENLSLM